MSNNIFLDIILGIVILFVVIFVIVTLARAIKIVPQATAGIVERLGKYHKTLLPGLNVLAPFVDPARVTIERKVVYAFHARVADRWRRDRARPLCGDRARCASSNRPSRKDERRRRREGARGGP